jgi:hypothetical protein
MFGSQTRSIIWLAVLVLGACSSTHSPPAEQAGGGGTQGADSGNGAAPDGGSSNAGSGGQAGAAGSGGSGQDAGANDAGANDAGANDAGANDAGGQAGSSAAGTGGAGDAGGGGASGAQSSAGAGGTQSSAGAGGTQGDSGAGGAGAGAAGSSGAGAGGAQGDSGAGGAGAGAAGSGGAAGAAGATGGCGADDTACSPATNVQGFCRGGNCVACTSGSDATSCSAAYGSGSGYVCVSGNCTAGNCVSNADCSNGQLCGLVSAQQCSSCTSDAECTGSGGYGAGYLCIAGGCVAANCRSDGDCPTGQICGLNSPNVCAACSTDTQCQNASGYGPAFVCDSSSSRCVSNACTPNNQPCSSNSADFCCAGTCTSGNCCAPSDCASFGNNYACVNHACTQCPQATNNTFYVDPVGGSDAAGTGDHTTTGCAFKSLSRALAVIGSSANPGTSVLVLNTGTLSTLTNGENFPIDVPANVIVSGSGGRPLILVPANTNGFLLRASHAGLANLTIDGQNQTAAFGVYVSAGSDSTTSVASLDVQNMGRDGIRVANSGVLTIQGGVNSTHNGSSGTPADGLNVGGQAHATIDPSGGDPIHFDQNTAHGIYVNGTGSIQLTGTPGSPGSGTVTTNGNVAAGLWIEQTPTLSPPTNLITGLVAWANLANGVRIVAGSAATMRNSVMLANGSNGLIVSTNVNGGTRNNDTSKIDLGTSAGPSYGGNTFQASLGSNPNSGAGLCLSIDRTAGSVLNAAGNIFAGPKNCASSSATLTKNSRCSGSVDYSVRSGGGGATTNSIVVSMCQ